MQRIEIRRKTKVEKEIWENRIGNSVVERRRWNVRLIPIQCPRVTNQFIIITKTVI